MKKKILIPIVIVVLLLLGAGIFVRTDVYEASQDALALLNEELPGITVKREDGRAAFHPEGADTGIIFYPGAKVDYRAYTPLMRELALNGFLSVLVKMPLNLAFLDIDAADAVVKDYPEIENWIIAGHSLGGAMAAYYAAGNTDKIDGLILFAAYSIRNLSDSGLQVLSMYGSEDLILNLEAYRKNYGNLPQLTVENIISGGNHAQFGDYGSQKGDGVALITPTEQIQTAAEIITQMF